MPKQRPPWRKPPSKASRKRGQVRLQPAQKKAARRSARRAGRRYPNLVDNMRAAREQKRRDRDMPRNNKRHRPTKDPKGGLTAAGRAEFARKQGARLEPGVKKRAADMTTQEMRRKGSWAVRFYGRAGRLPALQDKSGKPTRFALTAAAWGEPVPRTGAAARRIADRGRALLRRYQRLADR